MLPVLVLGALGWLAWWTTRHMFGFPGQFAELLHHPTRQGALSSLFTGHSSLSGRFQDRQVHVFYSRADEHQTGCVVVATPVAVPDQSVIRARSASSMNTQDRALERALAALEGTHGMRVDVENGWLRATWMPLGLFIFPGRFDAVKWTDVLANLHVTAERLEHRAAHVLEQAK